MSADETLREQLGEALAERRRSWNPDELAEIVTALLPVVESYAAQKAAEELETRAALCDRFHHTTPAQWLRNRAKVLRRAALSPATEKEKR